MSMWNDPDVEDSKNPMDMKDLKVKIAVVGTSSARKFIEDKAYDIINEFLYAQKSKHGDKLVIVSGGAEGIDQMTEELCEAHNIEMKVIEAPAEQWPDIGFGESRKIGYKTRDIQVAKMCCKIFNIVAKPCMLDEVPKWEQECHHCKTKDHQRSGGC